MTEFVSQCVQINLSQQVVDSVGTHLGNELLGIGILQFAVAFGQTAVDGHQIFLVQQDLILNQVVVATELLACHHTGLYNNVLLVVDDRLQFLGRYAEQSCDLRGQRTKIPDMSNRYTQLDMSHTLTTNLLLCYLYAATLAHDTFVTNTFVLSAVTLVILCRTENTLAEQTITLRLVCAVVDSLGLEHLTTGDVHNLFRRSQTNSDLGETGFLIFLS